MKKTAKYSKKGSLKAMLYNIPTPNRGNEMWGIKEDIRKLKDVIKAIIEALPDDPKEST